MSKNTALENLYTKGVLGVSKTYLYKQLDLCYGNGYIYYITLRKTSEPLRLYVKSGFTDNNENPFKRVEQQVIVQQKFNRVDETILLLDMIPVTDALKNYGNPSTPADKKIHKVFDTTNVLELKPANVNYLTNGRKTRDEWYIRDFENEDQIVAFTKYLNNFVRTFIKDQTILPFNSDVLKRIQPPELRPLQQNAAQKIQNGLLVWNEFLCVAPCRFGKTYVGCGVIYDILTKMLSTDSDKEKESKKTQTVLNVIVFSSKTDVKDEWKKRATEFGFGFISTTIKDGTVEEQYKRTVASGVKCVMCFVSVADVYQKNKEDGKLVPKKKNALLHSIEWDIGIGDEFHHTLNKSRSSHTFINEHDEYMLTYDEFPIKCKKYFYLTATPHYDLQSGRFEKGNYTINTLGDMYKSGHWNIPKMTFYTLKIDEEFLKKYISPSSNKFSNKVLFNVKKGKCTFTHIDDVIRFFKMLYETKDENGKNIFHLWGTKDKYKTLLRNCIVVMDEIKQVKAMKEFLESYFPVIFGKGKDKIEIITCTGNDNSTNIKDTINEIQLKTKTLTDDNYGPEHGVWLITCGKLLTGVTMPGFKSMLLLTDVESPIFLEQSVGRLNNEFMIDDVNMKPEVIVIDPNMNRCFSMRRDIDMIERKKYHRMSLKESYNITNQFVDFVCVSESGVFIPRTYQEYLSCGAMNDGAGNTYFTYSANTYGVTTDKEKLLQCREKYSYRFNGKSMSKQNNKLFKHKVTECSLIEKPKKELSGNGESRLKEKDETKITRQHLLCIFDKVAMFNYINGNNLAHCLKDLYNYPSDKVQKVFKFTIDELIDMVADGTLNGYLLDNRFEETSVIMEM